MITYRYAEIKIEDEAYVFIELLDYDQGKDMNVFDTIQYNNKSFKGKILLMHNKKAIPSAITSRGVVVPLSEFVKDRKNTESLIWCGPFTL